MRVQRALGISLHAPTRRFQPVDYGDSLLAHYGTDDAGEDVVYRHLHREFLIVGHQRCAHPSRTDVGESYVGIFGMAQLLESVKIPLVETLC